MHAERILMAPGPSNLPPSVLQALMRPLLGHKDPEFLAAMEETAALLRTIFQTRNRATFALPATGGSGMEASLINLLQPGDTVLIGVSGFFATRLVGIAERLHQVTVKTVEAPWGQAIRFEHIVDALKVHRPRVLALVHGETSTGVEQPLHGLASVCREMDTLLVVDAVASLGGTPLPVDELGLDVCYGGSQKCLSAPPGVAPVTVSDRALRAIDERTVPVQSWYLDLSLHARFWDTEHVYHHTAPVLNVFALQEAVRLAVDEGLEKRFQRHRLHAQALCTGLEALGLHLFADPAHRLVPVITVLVPDGLSAPAIRTMLLDEFGVEIAGGLGEFADRMLRIGIMGHSARRTNVMLVLAALESALRLQGHPIRESATLAAEQVYTDAPAYGLSTSFV